MELKNLDRRVSKDYVNTKVNQQQHGASHSSSHIYTVPNSSQIASKESYEYAELEGFKRRILERLKKRQICVVFAILALLILSVVAIAVVLGIHILIAGQTNGGWSVWSDWNVCSTTCDTGLQTRQRQCSNPVPSSGGQYCEGSPMDFNLCNKKQCPRIREGTETNGGWSVWSGWSVCSATCDTGVQTRQRQCNNPVPSSGGQYCEGSPMEVVHCNKQLCPQTDGGWSAWSWWTSCSATCNTGLKTRQRHCNNFKPSNGGRDCDGSAMEVVLCNQQSCPRAEYDMIAFTSRLERELVNLRPNTTVVFGKIITNIGENYDNNTGIFTCPRSGLYLFAVFVQSATQHETLLALKMNGEMYLTAVSEPSAAGQDESGGNVVLLNVVAGSRVWIETYSVDNQYLWPWRTTFSGVLIKPY